MFITTGLGGAPQVFDVRNSLRFNDDDSAHLTDTLVNSNPERWTLSMWVKRGALGTVQDLFSRGADANNHTTIRFGSADTIDWVTVSVSSTVQRLTTTQLFRDPSSWYHLVFVCDTANATADDRHRIYVNGQLITAYSTRTNPSQGLDLYINLAAVHYIGRLAYSASEFFDGYMAEVHFLDDRAFDASFFGETDLNTGMWKPKKTKFTAAEYGVNGFYLDFKDTTTASATALGADKAPTGPVGHTAANNWTPVNFQVTADAAFEFRSDGVTLGPQAGINTNSNNYVLWNWKEDPVAGFDIVQYTGNGANRTINHSLGAIPQMIVTFDLSGGYNHKVYHSSVGATQYLDFNNTSNALTASTVWNNTAPTSSVFSLGTGAPNVNGDNYVAYLWTEVPGYSRFGSYTGNGNADGPFIMCGFRPKWVLIKRTDVSGGWMAFDSARIPFNATAYPLLYTYLPDAEVAASSSYGADFLSTGFKVRTADTWHNALNGIYVFAAFAETPFKYGNAR